ncbi:MAG: PAS domain-containing sensor histidine kinase, partial [Pseudoxanthomonas sp.]|nr:PAS domain-containing sensor histidine kinase [Pseudoxanthomonas sp.]
VLVDAAQFEVAIVNLLNNSRDAMPLGGTILISTQLDHFSPPADPESEGQAFVCVTVKDPGTGMSEEVVRRATEPFFTTKEVGKGSGLGLSQVSGFASQSGGFASVTSQVGEGTTVQICLPALEQ